MREESIARKRKDTRGSAKTMNPNQHPNSQYPSNQPPNSQYPPNQQQPTPTQNMAIWNSFAQFMQSGVDPSLLQAFLSNQHSYQTYPHVVHQSSSDAHSAIHSELPSQDSAGASDPTVLPGVTDTSRGRRRGRDVPMERTPRAPNWSLEEEETPLPNENRATSQPQTPITDDSPFQASNGNDVNDEDQRSIGKKATKRAKARSKSSKGDASSQVSKSIHAGLNEMMQTSRLNWEFFMKQSEEEKAQKVEYARLRDEEEKQALEQERRLSMKATRSTILRNIAAITRDLLGATRELRELANNSMHDPNGAAEYNRHKALVEDLEHQLEEFKKENSALGASRARAPNVPVSRSGNTEFPSYKVHR